MNNIYLYFLSRNSRIYLEQHFWRIYVEPETGEDSQMNEQMKRVMKPDKKKHNNKFDINFYNFLTFFIHDTFICS